MTQFSNAVTGVSITTAADGMPHLITRNSFGFLYQMFIHCNDPLCQGGDETINQWASSPSGTDPSVTIGSDGFPVVASYGSGGSSNGLHVRHTTNVQGSASAQNYGTVLRVGLITGPSITIGRDGLPLIAFRDGVNGDLRVAHCNDVACVGGGVSDSLVNATNDTGYYASLAIGADGLPIIAYHDATLTGLLVTHCNDALCAGGDETTTIVDRVAGQNYGSWASLAIGTDGLPVIAHADINNGRLRVTRCNDVACTGNDETSTSLPATQFTIQGYKLSMTIGPSGFPVIAHVLEWVDVGSGFDDQVQDLLVTECNDLACTGGDETTTLVDNQVNVGDTDITLDGQGNPIIAYSDSLSQRVKVAVQRKRSWSMNAWGR